MVSEFSETEHRGPPPTQPVPWSVWTSEDERPPTTQQALRSEHTEIALLKSTIGNQNYLLPEDADADSIRSIVIWCEPVRIAYTAASLEDR